MATLTYSPDSVMLIFGGYHATGWNTIAIQRNEAMVKQIRGIRGKNAKEYLPDTSCTISLTVPQAAEVNTILSEVLKLEEQSRGKVRLEIMLKDTSGGSVFTSVECYIGGWPSIEYTDSLSDVEWTFLCDSSEWSLAGNEANRNSLTDLVSGALGAVTGAAGGLFS